MIGISWYNFEKSDRKDTWSALFLCKKGELVQGCIEKGQSQKGDSRQRKLSWIAGGDKNSKKSETK